MPRYISQTKAEYINSLQGALDIDHQETCTICYENFDTENHRAVSVVCGHSYCRDCLSTWLENADSCPTCRKTIYTGIITIYDQPEDTAAGFDKGSYPGSEQDLRAAVVQALEKRVGFVADMGQYILLQSTFGYDRFGGQIQDVLIREAMNRFRDALPQALPDHAPAFDKLVTIDEEEFREFMRARMPPLPETPPESLAIDMPDEGDIVAENASELRNVASFLTYCYRHFVEKYKAELVDAESELPRLPAEVKAAFQNIPAVRLARENIVSIGHQFCSAAARFQALFFDLRVLDNNPWTGQVILYMKYSGSRRKLEENIRSALDTKVECLNLLVDEYEKLIHLYTGTDPALGY